MKNQLCLLLLTMLLTYVVDAQQVAPFQLKDRKAIAINKKVLNKLVDKTWVAYKQYYVQGEEASSYTSSSFFALKLRRDGQYESMVAVGGREGGRGQWEVAQQKILSLIPSIDTSAQQKQATLVGGGYAIYKIDDQDMILSKTLTSDQQLRIVYCLKASMLKPVANVAEKNQPKPKTAAANINNRFLIDEIRAELFLRQLKAPRNLEKMDREALLTLKKKILDGTY